tara:strand:+ start:961 stop:2406 length:1446 start_codon:yes stop_codon:yes gene_type:complete
MNIAELNLIATLPLLFLAVWSCVLLLLGLWIPKHRIQIVGWLAFLGLLVSIVLLVFNVPLESQEAFGGMLVFDGFALVVHVLLLLSSMLVILLSFHYIRIYEKNNSEFYSLLIFSLLGMMILAVAKNLIVVFLAIELLSIPLYVLVGLDRDGLRSRESALKYFLLGAFASAFQVYGIALVYGATQSTDFVSISLAIASQGSTPLMVSGLGLVLVGFCFKVGVVPFHMWTPDVYEGAPTVVTAFMSVGAKVAGFAALVRVLFQAFEFLVSQWAMLVVVLVLFSTIVGNISAISQSSIKRLLAFSSVAHAGYLFVAMVAGGQGVVSDFAASAVLFYLIAYALANVGAWAIVIALESKNSVNIKDYAGLVKTNPGLAVAMTIFILSLTGLPPTMGFVAKFYVFRAAINLGYTWLVIASVITVLISAYYYLRVIVLMWMKDGNLVIKLPFSFNVVLVLTSIGTLIFGVFPTPIMLILENYIRGMF